MYNRQGADGKEDLHLTPEISAFSFNQSTTTRSSRTDNTYGPKTDYQYVSTPCFSKTPPRPSSTVPVPERPSRRPDAHRKPTVPVFPENETIRTTARKPDAIPKPIIIPPTILEGFGRTSVPNPAYIATAAPNPNPDRDPVSCHGGCGCRSSRVPCRILRIIVFLTILAGVLGVVYHESKLALQESAEIEAACYRLRTEETERSDFHVVVSGEIARHNDIMEYQIDMRDMQVCEENMKVKEADNPEERSKLIIEKQERQRTCMEKERDDIYELTRNRIRETSADVKAKLEENKKQNTSGLGRNLEMVMSRSRVEWGKKTKGRRGRYPQRDK